MLIQEKRLSWNFLFLIALYFIALRGFFILLTSDLVKNVGLIYFSSSLLFYFLGAVGLYKVLVNQSRIQDNVKYLLVANFIFVTHWMIIELLVSDYFVILINYYSLIAIAPFSLVLFFKFREKSIYLFLALATLIIAFYVIYDFVQLNNFFGFGDLSAARSRHEIIRPSLPSLSKSNNLYRPVGILGPLPHNSAQINAMLSVYWFLILFNTKKIKFFFCTMILFVFSFLALILSFVTSNIIAAVLGMGFGVLTIILFLNKNLTSVILVCLLIAVIITFAAWQYDFDWAIPIIKAVTLRVNVYTGDWGNTLDWRSGNFFSDVLAFLFGHSFLMGSRLDTLEIGIIGLIFQFGIFVVFPFYFLLNYPVIKLLLSRSSLSGKSHYLAESMALLTGFLTLWHYRSLLQTPNLIIFFAIYSSALIKMSDGASSSSQDF